VRDGASANGDHHGAFGKRRQEVVVARGESFRQKTPRYRMSALEGQLRGWQTGTYLSRHNFNEWPIRGTSEYEDHQESGANIWSLV
jgi:hypothetical protein